LQEHAAAHHQRGHRGGFEGVLGIVLEGHLVALGHALEECAVARGALRVQPEVGYGLLAQQHDFHVAAAAIADRTGVREEVQRGGGVGDGLDDRHIRADDVLEQDLAKAGDTERADPGYAGVADLPEHRLRVLDRVAARRGIAREQQLAVPRERDGLGRRAAEVAA